jgi:hypothetical protein
MHKYKQGTLEATGFMVFISTVEDHFGLYEFLLLIECHSLSKSLKKFLQL